MGTYMIRIADCAKVLPGYALKARAEHEPEGGFQVVMAKHLSDGMFYRYVPGHELRMTPKGKAEKYRVLVGDVLFISRGARNCAAVVESVPEDTVASATFYILRPTARVDPGYLAWCLNQPPTQAQISQVRTGAGTPIVQRSVFADIVIPLPPMIKQKHLAALGRLMARELELLKQLANLTKTYHKAIGSKLISQYGGMDAGGTKDWRTQS